MTDKHSFLGRLKERLIAKGVSEADAAPYLSQFDKYYDRMASDDLATAETLLDIESIADNITSQVKERYEEIDRLAAMSMSTPIVAPEDMPTMEAQIPAVTDDIIEDVEEYEVFEDTDQDELVPYEDYATEEIAGESEAVSAEAEEITEYTEESSTRLPDYVEPEKIQESKMFWLLFAVSLPVTLPLALIVLLIFGVMWGGLAAVTAGAVLALIGAVCAGTAVSLVGIIYGIAQFKEAIPVGLYEIGIGIVAAGITLCVGILIYNFTVRLMPKLFKLVTKLFKYTMKRLKELFNYLRKESAKL